MALEPLMKLVPRLAPTFVTPQILAQLAMAHRYLGELKGQMAGFPNEVLLLAALKLHEPQASSEIENIVTSRDSLHKLELGLSTGDSATRKAALYAEALAQGFDKVKETQLLTNKTILTIQGKLIENNAGLRKLPGTVVKNTTTGEVVHTPPEPQELLHLLSDLEAFINADSPGTEGYVDPLIKMAIIHHRFETIHPFYDGNGRVGRIINILYLVKEGLLEVPVLYLSRYISQHKNEYYKILQSIQDLEEAQWQEWILYMLEGVALTAQSTTEVTKKILSLLQKQKLQIREQYPKIYKHSLLNHLFQYPYTTVRYTKEALAVTQPTALRYLNILADGGILQKEKVGRRYYYFNTELMHILDNIPLADRSSQGEDSRA